MTIVMIVIPSNLPITQHFFKMYLYVLYLCVVFFAVLYIFINMFMFIFFHILARVLVPNK